ETVVGVHTYLHPGAYVCLSVTDNGVGMDEATRNRVFEPFFTTKKPGKGTGLGMSMAYGLAKQQKGFVNVYSEPGEGTTVRVYLPAAQELEALPVPVPSFGKTTAGGETILIVEDEKGVREVAQKALERHGFVVMTASDGLEGLELIKRHQGQIDLVLSDVVMPGMTGYDLCREVAALKGPKPRILLATGYAGRDMAHVRPEGIRVPVIEKPWTLSGLLTRINEMLRAEAPTRHLGGPS
ncbi:MAG: response regulator, partial [Gemmatimonadota bacterium]